jgi:YVTN family beta-propeller protein
VRSLLAAALVLAAAAPAAAATLLVTNTKSDSASVIDTDTLEVVTTIPLGKGKPNRIVFHPDGKTAWVVYDKSHDLGVIDVEGRKLARRLKIVTPDGRHLLVLDWSSDTSNDEVIFYDLNTEKIDTGTNKEVGRIALPGIVHEATLTLDGKFLYATLRKANKVPPIS